MRLFKQFLFVALLLAIGVAPAFAGVLLDFTPITGWDAAQAAQLPPLESGWSAYLMSARSDDDSLISAVDVQLRGTFAQRWGFEEENPLGIPTPTGLSRSGFDSHLLPSSDSLLISSTVHEDLGGSPLTMPSGARVGSGTSLRGVWGIPGNVQRSALDLAYVVIPSGSLDQLDYAVDIATRESVFNLRKGFAAPADTPTPPDFVFMGEPAGAPIKTIPQGELNFKATQNTHLNLTRLDTIDPLSSMLTVLQPGWTGYLLSATATDSAKFSAVDIKLQGSFHQYWGFSEDAGEALATVQSVSRSGVDTHLLPAVDAILLSDQFGEDLGPERNATAGGSAYGVGNSIKGVWGVPGGSQAQSLDLAYIVAPEGLTLDQLQYSVDLARTDGGTASLRNGFAMPDAPPVIPPTVVQEGTNVTPPGYDPHGSNPISPPAPPVTVNPPTLPSLPPDDQPAPPPLPPTLPPVAPPTTTQLSLTRLDTLNPATQPLSITQPGWAGYLLSATSLDGAKFSAVDVKLQGNFHQYWGFSEDAGEALATVQSASRSGVDTHLLPAADAILLADQFGEDLGPERNTTSGGGVYGVGESIKGVWGIPGGSQATTLDLAYIVAPEGFSLEQLKYSIDLARTEGGVANLRNGFAIPEPPLTIPTETITVTGEALPRTPGTTLEHVTREDGSIVLEERPIPGWQPGDPWGGMPWVPPTIFQTSPPVDEILFHTTDTIQKEYLGGGLLEAVRKAGATTDVADYVVLTTQIDFTNIDTTDVTGIDLNSAAWPRGSTGVAYGVGDFIAFDSDSSLADTMLSKGGDSFEAVPEPSAIVITLAGITLLFRRRVN